MQFLFFTLLLLAPLGPVAAESHQYKAGWMHIDIDDACVARPAGDKVEQQRLGPSKFLTAHCHEEPKSTYKDKVTYRTADGDVQCKADHKFPKPPSHIAGCRKT